MAEGSGAANLFVLGGLGREPGARSSLLFLCRSGATAADGFYHYGGGLTPVMAEPIKRAFRDAHQLAYLKREELVGSDREDFFNRVVGAARTALAETIGADETEDERV